MSDEENTRKYFTFEQVTNGYKGSLREGKKLEHYVFNHAEDLIEKLRSYLEVKE